MSPDLIDRLRAASSQHAGRIVQASSLETEAADALEDAKALIATGAALAVALRRYGFPVSGGARASLTNHGSSEAMAVDYTARAFIAALASIGGQDE